MAFEELMLSDVEFVEFVLSIVESVESVSPGATISTSVSFKVLSSDVVFFVDDELNDRTKSN